MTENKFLQKWYDHEFDDWGGVTSTDYKQFEKEYRTVLRELCKKIDFQLIRFLKNHYEFSAVVQDKQTMDYLYLSITDVRFWQNDWANKILCRQMQNDHDWKGGTNHYTTLLDLSKNLEKISNSRY